MFGAILGDIIGSPFEFDRGNKSKKFPLFSEDSQFTDDTVMTLAVFYAFYKFKTRTEDKYKLGWYYTNVAPTEENMLKDLICESMQYWGRRFPYAGYGSNFNSWLYSEAPIPYNSFGNGSAMRVSCVGWMFGDLETTRKMARISAEVTHNHPEGIKGAEAVASAIFLARNGYSKEYIREYITNEFGYDLNRTCDEIRPDYRHVESCQETVPEAIIAFLEGKSFIDVIRTAVSLGGDCDTLTAIAGSIAEAFYGVSNNMQNECFKRLPNELRYILRIFYWEYIIEFNR